MFYIKLYFITTVLASVVLVISAESSQAKGPDGCKTENLQGQSVEAATSLHTMKESLKIAIMRETEQWRSLSFGFTDDVEVTNGLLKFQRGQNSDVIVTVKHLPTEKQNAGGEISEQVVNILVAPEQLFPFKNWTFVTLEVVNSKLKLSLEGFAGIIFNQIDASIFRKIFVHTMQGQDVSVGFNCIKGDMYYSSLPEENDQNIPLIAGVTVVVFIIIVSFLALYVVKRKRRKTLSDEEQGKVRSEGVKSKEGRSLLYAPEDVDDSTREKRSFPTASDRNEIPLSPEVETSFNESCNPASTSKTDSKPKDSKLKEKKKLSTDTKESNESIEHGNLLRNFGNDGGMNGENISFSSVKSSKDTHDSSQTETSCNKSRNLASLNNTDFKKKDNVINEEKVSIDTERVDEISEHNSLLRSSALLHEQHGENKNSSSSVKSRNYIHDGMFSKNTHKAELVTNVDSRTNENANTGEKGKLDNRNQMLAKISVDCQHRNKEILSLETSAHLTNSSLAKKGEERDLLAADRSPSSFKSSSSTQKKGKKKQKTSSSKEKRLEKSRNENPDLKSCTELEQEEKSLSSNHDHDPKAEESSETKPNVSNQLNNSSAVNISRTSHDNKQQNTDRNKEKLLTESQRESAITDATRTENKKDSKKSSLSTFESHKDKLYLSQAENSPVDKIKISLGSSKNPPKRQNENNLENAVELCLHSIKDNEIAPSDSTSQYNDITQSQLSSLSETNRAASKNRHIICSEPSVVHGGRINSKKNTLLPKSNGSSIRSKEGCEAKADDDLIDNDHKQISNNKNHSRTQDNAPFNETFSDQLDLTEIPDNASTFSEEKVSSHTLTEAPHSPMETGQSVEINTSTRRKRPQNFQSLPEQQESSTVPKKARIEKSQINNDPVKLRHVDAKEEMEVCTEKSHTNNEKRRQKNTEEPTHTLQYSDEEDMKSEDEMETQFSAFVT